MGRAKGNLLAERKIQRARRAVTIDQWMKLYGFPKKFNTEIYEELKLKPEIFASFQQLADRNYIPSLEEDFLHLADADKRISDLTGLNNIPHIKPRERTVEMLHILAASPGLEAKLNWDEIATSNLNSARILSKTQIRRNEATEEDKDIIELSLKFDKWDKLNESEESDLIKKCCHLSDKYREKNADFNQIRDAIGMFISSMSYPDKDNALKHINIANLICSANIKRAEFKGKDYTPSLAAVRASTIINVELDKILLKSLGIDGSSK